MGVDSSVVILWRTCSARDFESGSFQAKFLKPIESLVTAGTAEARMFAKQKIDIDDPSRSARLTDRLLNRIER